MILLERNAFGRGIPSGVSTEALLALVISCAMVPLVAAGQSTTHRQVLAGSVSVGQRTSIHAVEAGQQTFSSAAEATEALFAALEKGDEPALLRVLGTDAKNILSSGDEAEDKEHRTQFVQKYQQLHRMVTETDGLTTLYIGAENWPTPIPLAHRDNAWYFDTVAAKDEILYRRVGENELTVIQVCGELVDAQKEYNSQQRDGAAERQYATKIMSDPDKRNGLYWKASVGESQSPLGPLVASAEREGYAGNSSLNTQPFHGYYFRVLKGQGAHAPGGSQSYIADGKMTRGFAFLAYPAEYRSSGVMTFLVGRDGVVYERDLGRGTDEAAKSLLRYNRDASWRKAN